MDKHTSQWLMPIIACPLIYNNCYSYGKSSAQEHDCYRAYDGDE